MNIARARVLHKFQATLLIFLESPGNINFGSIAICLMLFIQISVSFSDMTTAVSLGLIFPGSFISKKLAHFPLLQFLTLHRKVIGRR